ncbi:unnamed protein product, partial [Effrenium voratum]
ARRESWQWRICLEWWIPTTCLKMEKFEEFVLESLQYTIRRLCLLEFFVHQQILTFVNAESDSRSEQLDALRSLVRKLESIGELERLFLQLHRLRVMTETLSSKER